MVPVLKDHCIGGRLACTGCVPSVVQTPGTEETMVWGGRGVREELSQLRRAQVSLGSDTWILSSRMGGGSMQQRRQERACVLDTFSGPLPDPPPTSAVCWGDGTS